MIGLFYIFLIISTVGIFYLSKKVWNIQNDLIFQLTILIIYYFTLGGAWIFPLDSYYDYQGMCYGLHYTPIFERLFVVNFDSTYFLSVFYYVLFILTFQLSYLFLLKKLIPKDSFETFISNGKLKINVFKLALLSFGLIILSIYFLRNEIWFAIIKKKSIYLITRANKNNYYTLHQLANEFCVLVPFIVYILYITKNQILQISEKKHTLYILFGICFISALYVAILGNRREILSALIISLLLIYKWRKSFKLAPFVSLFLLVIIMFLGNHFFRSDYIPGKINAMITKSKTIKPTSSSMPNFKTEEDIDPKFEKVIVDESEPDIDYKSKFKESVGSVILSNELFYAHFSMYGVLKKDIPLTYGSSFISLFASIIPRAIMPNRPEDIYTYYAKSVGATPGQIYTIHHATGWYLNFGFIGIMFGAIILALAFISGEIISSLLSKKLKSQPILTVLSVLIPYLLCAQMVTFISSGLEAYKSMVLEGVVIPIILLRFCIVKLNNSNP